jgi:hypothetical protein
MNKKNKKNTITNHGASTARVKVNHDRVAKPWQTLTLRRKI